MRKLFSQISAVRTGVRAYMDATRVHRSSNLQINRSTDPPIQRSADLGGVYINAKFAINLHHSYKKNLAIKSLCIFYKETLPDTLSLSLTGIRLSPKQARRVNNGQLISSRLMDICRNSPTIKFCAGLFPAHRCSSVIKFQRRLECASVNRSNLLLISNQASFPANKMN